MDDRTRVLAISHVEFASGFRNDLDALAELCHARGVALFVDAIQGLGPLADRRPADADRLPRGRRPQVAARPRGGRPAVRPARLDRPAPADRRRLEQRDGSYNDPEPRFDLKPDAGRWEGGCYNMPACSALGKSLELLLEIGPERVSERILDRAEAVRERAVARRLASRRVGPAGGPLGDRRPGPRGVRPERLVAGAPGARGRRQLPTRAAADQPAPVQ